MAASMPQDGARYLASLRDGRSILHRGELIEDVTVHPAFAGTATSIAGLYDRLHGEGQDALLAPTEDGRGRTHAFYAIPRSREDLRRQREAVRGWQSASGGWLGRSPEFMGCVWTSIGSVPEFFGEFEGNARRLFAEAQRELVHYAHALVNPPVDRTLPVDDGGVVFVHAVRETDAGIVVRGSKVVTTGAPTAQRVFVSHFGGELRTKPFALAFVARLDAPGVRLYARRSYQEAAAAGPIADAPFTARFDENDAIVVFDDVLIPWDDVLIHDVDTMLAFNAGAVGWSPRLAFQSATRLEVKLETIIGLVARALQITGAAEVRGVRVQLGELLASRHLVAGLRDAMIEGAVPGPGGSILPAPHAAVTFAALAPDHYSRMRTIIETIVSSGLIHRPSSIADFDSEHAADLDRVLRGSNGIDARERTLVMQALWDAIGSEFGARHELYERNYWGQPEKSFLALVDIAERTGATELLVESAARLLRGDGGTVAADSA